MASLKPEDVEKIDKEYAAVIKKQATKAILKMPKRIGIGYIWFRFCFARQQVKYWKERQLEKNWPQIFPQVQIQVEVKANMRRSGLTTDSITFK